MVSWKNGSIVTTFCNFSMSGHSAELAYIEITLELGSKSNVGIDGQGALVWKFGGWAGMFWQSHKNGSHRFVWFLVRFRETDGGEAIRLRLHCVSLA